MSILSEVRSRKVSAHSGASTGTLLLLLEFSCTGGVKFSTEPVKDKTPGAKTSKVTKHVDDLELEKNAKGLINAAYVVVERHAAKTPFGPIMDARNLPVLKEDLREIQEAAEILNQIAENMQSDRRVKVELYSIPFPTDDRQIIRRVNEYIREGLSDMRSALRSGDTGNWPTLKDHVRNFESLLPMTQRIIFETALKAAKDSRSELKALLRQGLSPPEAGRKLNLILLENAIKTFSITSL